MTINVTMKFLQMMIRGVFAFCLLLTQIGGSAQAADPTASPITLSPAPSITRANEGEWFINRVGETVGKPLSDRPGSNFIFNLPFNTSNRDRGATILDVACVTPFANSDKYFDVDTTTPTSDKSDGFIQFDTTVIMNITSLETSEYWTVLVDEETGDVRGGYITICVETYLTYTNVVDLGNGIGIGEEKIANQYNLLYANVGLASSFAIGNGTDDNGDNDSSGGIVLADYWEQIKNGTNDADVGVDFSDKVISYECKETNLYQPVTGKTYNQGDQVNICVTTKADAFAEIEEFDNLKVAQTGIPDYHYIKNSVWNPEMTTLQCQAGSMPSEPRVCVATIILLSRFFSSATPSALSITGSVHMKFGGRRVRRSVVQIDVPISENDHEDQDALSTLGRRTQEEEEEGNGEFQVEISLQSASDNDSASPANRLTSGAIAGGLISVAIGAIEGALMA